MNDEAFTPLADGVSVTIQLFGDLLVGGVSVGSGVEDEATAEDQRLRRGTNTEQGLQLVTQLRCELDPRGKWPWHDVLPCAKENEENGEGVIMAAVSTFVQPLAADL